MGHKDTTGMGATFDVWVSAVERGETPEEGEWPARDRVPVVRDAAYWRSVTNGVFAFDPALGPDHMPARGFAEQTIAPRPAEVTEDMIVAGVSAADDAWLECTKGPINPHLTAIHRAMHVAAPVPPVSDAEIALTRERDEARAELTKERAWTMRLGVDHTSLTVENRFLRAELMAARDQLAKFTAQNAPETEAPDPIANALNVSRKAPKWP